MKKTTTKIAAISMLAIALFTACDSDKYIEDISNMPEEKRQENEELLNEYLDKYENSQSDLEKMENAFEVGFRYSVLGRNDKAIPYFEEVIEFDPQHYPALSNLAEIYKKAGEIEKALEYERTLLQYNPDTPEVIRDMVDLLIIKEQYKEARSVLMTYSLTEKGAKEEEFIRSQMEEIAEKEKAKPKTE